MAKKKTFRVVCTYAGFSSELDRKLFSAAEKVLGGRGGFSDGSGCGLGERDHEWNNLSLSQAEALEAAFKVLSLPVSVYHEREEAY